MLKPYSGALRGNDRFEGFCVDLLHQLAHNLGFEFELYLVPDGKYGEQINDTDEWDGMIGEILSGVGLGEEIMSPSHVPLIDHIFSGPTWPSGRSQ